jgi:hypothetical protein
MPRLLAELKESKKPYLPLCAVREAITRANSLPNGEIIITPYLDQVCVCVSCVVCSRCDCVIGARSRCDCVIGARCASQLTALLIPRAASSDEGTRSVIAECLGKLGLLAPAHVLPALQALLADKAGAARATAVLALKCCVVDRPHKV